MAFLQYNVALEAVILVESVNGRPSRALLQSSPISGYKFLCPQSKSIINFLESYEASKASRFRLVRKLEPRDQF